MKLWSNSPNDVSLTWPPNGRYHGTVPMEGGRTTMVKQLNYGLKPSRPRTKKVWHQRGRIRLPHEAAHRNHTFIAGYIQPMLGNARARVNRCIAHRQLQYEIVEVTGHCKRNARHTQRTLLSEWGMSLDSGRCHTVPWKSPVVWILPIGRAYLWRGEAADLTANPQALRGSHIQ